MNSQEKKDLKNNPIFHLSLGSKELFHSNFLYWLFILDREKFSDLISTIVNKKDLGPPTNCLREENNIDLTVEFNNSCKVFIEVKVKSVPCQDQLDKYSKKLNNGGENYFVLLTMQEPKSINFDKINWKYYLFEKFVQKIREIYLTNQTPIYAKHYIEDYVRLVKSLCKLINAISVSSNDFYDHKYFDEKNSPLSDYKELRIHDLYLKNIYSKLSEFLRKEFENKVGDLNTVSGADRWVNISNEKGFYYENSFHNGKGTITFFKPIKPRKYGMGIQLEGRQYRQFLLAISSEKGADVKNKLEGKTIELKERELYFDLNHTWPHSYLTPMGKGRSESRFKDFCSYITARKNYVEYFIYKYIRFPNSYDGKDRPVRIKDISASIIRDFKDLNKNLEKIKKYY